MKPQAQPRIRLRPFQIIESQGHVYLRRGVIRMALEGDGLLDILARLQEAATRTACTREELLSWFAPPQHDMVDALVRHLVSRKLACFEPDAGEAEAESHEETSQDIFFLHAGLSSAEVRKSTAGRIAMVGVNDLALRTRQRLGEFGQWQVELIDDVPLRNHALFQSATAVPCISDAVAAEQLVRGASLVIACAEFGGQSLLLPWNAVAIEQGVPFLPVVIEDLTVYVGPLVIPGETPCLSCLAARQNSNLKNWAEHRAMERFAGEGQRFAAHHPAILEIAGSLTAFEALRFATGMFPRRIGKLIEFNLMGSSMVAQRVLKAPRCPACSSLRHLSKLSIDKRLTDVDAWEHIERMGGAYDKRP